MSYALLQETQKRKEGQGNSSIIIRPSYLILIQKRKKERICWEDLEGEKWEYALGKTSSGGRSEGRKCEHRVEGDLVAKKC